MMPFELVEPTSLKEALALLDDGVKAWGAISPRPNAASLKEMYFDEEIARLKLAELLLQYGAEEALS